MLEWAIQTLDGSKDLVTLPQAEKIWSILKPKNLISTPKPEEGRPKKSLFLLEKEFELIKLGGELK
jgi:hypothetical protein